MSFNESNTVEQMILDAVTKRMPGRQIELRRRPRLGTLRSVEIQARWEYVPALQLPRQSGDVMVGSWVRECVDSTQPRNRRST